MTATFQLTQKESELLKDAMKQEKLCVEKYTLAADKAQDGQLKNLFSAIAREEQQHYDTLHTLSEGTLPSMAGGSPVSDSMTFTQTYTGQDKAYEEDRFLCQDLLGTEKYVSHVYDTAVFEFCDRQPRDILNHIQKEEQKHGLLIYEYMSKNGMYR